MNIFFSRIYGSKWGKAALGTVAGAGMLLAAALPAQAASLTQAQIGAITALLASFNVASDTIANVQAILSGQAGTSSGSSGTASSTSAVITGTMIGFLHKGDNGQGVCYLHALLAADPNISINITASDAGGNCPFGSLTEKALKQFQKEHGIEAAGFIGPRTLKAIEQDLEDNQIGDQEDDSGHHTACAIVPPGHLVAPGWLRHHDDDRPVVPTCETLPPGIENKHGGDDNEGDMGTTTTSVASTTTEDMDTATASSTSSATTTEH